MHYLCSGMLSASRLSFVVTPTLLVLVAACSSCDASGTASSPAVTETRWVDKVALSDGATASFFDVCTMGGSVCPDGVELGSRDVAVGDEIQGMKVGAIKCQLYSRDIRGWRGGPDFVARKGKWNCTASIDETAAENSVSESGNRTYPAVVVLKADL